tara:strand:+ start:350 stop:547 length:198 start_codon:yes stop_codon:yes gene_type:complete
MKISQRNDYQTFNTAMNIPEGWVQLTCADPLHDLEFAIEQLEKANKKYAICEHRDNRVSVWVRKP